MTGMTAFVFATPVERLVAEKLVTVFLLIILRDFRNLFSEYIYVNHTN